jgi:CheY-like chemotaxis protein
MVKRLLCVDDDKITQTLNKLIVTRASFAEEIITRMNGKEALDFYTDLCNDAAVENYPELIFLDLNMPCMNGWDFLDEFVEKFQMRFCNTRVVILSSSIAPAEKAKAAKYPIVIDYLSKPLTINALKTISGFGF